MKNKLSKNAFARVLQELVKNRKFKCKDSEDWKDQYELYENLRKGGLVRRTKEKIDGENWFVYTCTSKAEQTYQKIKHR